MPSLAVSCSHKPMAGSPFFCWRDPEQVGVCGREATGGLFGLPSGKGRGERARASRLSIRRNNTFFF